MQGRGQKDEHLACMCLHTKLMKTYPHPKCMPRESLSAEKMEQRSLSCLIYNDKKGKGSTRIHLKTHTSYRARHVRVVGLWSEITSHLIFPSLFHSILQPRHVDQPILCVSSCSGSRLACRLCLLLTACSLLHRP